MNTSLKLATEAHGGVGRWNPLNGVTGEIHLLQIQSYSW
jgi:hypothetical protein